MSAPVCWDCFSGGSNADRVQDLKRELEKLITGYGGFDEKKISSTFGYNPCSITTLDSSGKGSGNSTQKYIVTHIYSDYIYSLIVEEYGALGGVFIMFLYLSLLARGAAIARNCTNTFAKYTVGGLSLMITAQAMMHIMVNLDIGFRTGQTLPLISDGRFAFIMFCIAFGIILSISRQANNTSHEV